ncbi:MAG: ABC transporter ATP-binding protein [Bacillota bacterium]|uniref:ABC transporter ATP-binding protein n=1 Tax=Virgibacillus salarius TaxID=447199 RepID=A0A941DZ08_9BACI|nr:MULTISPECIES: ABC transporter ATP-binding protein [Bacillaceae]NAZ10675.1 ATP-binding cassette domain-containing protein [Agaribacter marinus]MBR7797966.1 ABC transporter ATP-binding protein [Virgibacillus salarius]MCC2248351.1 ABC transporter ATP-binding protein [Virgibacillus sp. AGTR]MDY7045210.1 ABC transporter ATP-binding protein [Virgibacillus sp. M23]QRZ16433.1 ABC transporter ATP-binding protein [Virgibacillus sp. AGTR]
MIEITNVQKGFPGNSRAIEDLSLTIPDGKIVGFLGPNGAGKSTTIKMMTGILPIDKGSITLNGIPIDKNSIEAKKTFGYVPDQPDMFLRLKGIEYLNFIGDIYNVPQTIRQERIDTLTKQFQIHTSLQDYIQTYSHGMRQKIIVTGVLLHDPSIWILDEPLTGLDPKSAYTLKDMMRQHADKGNTVFFSSHGLEVVEQLCDMVAIINKGKLLFYGDMKQLHEEYQTDQSLEAVFLELTNDE